MISLATRTSLPRPSTFRTSMGMFALVAAGALLTACGDDNGGSGGSAGTGGGSAGQGGDGRAASTSTGSAAGTTSATSTTTSAGTGGEGGSAPFDECPAATQESACLDADGNAVPSGIIRGVARLAPGVTVPAGTTGDLIIGLMHGHLGKEEVGGHPHWFETVPSVDLSAGPVPFELDMCGGGTAMWSEDNCEYNLVVMLDTNDNAGVRGNRLVVQPDADEVGWHQLFNLSCRGESLCMDVTMGCLGPDCVNFEPLGECACAPESCDSDDSICK